HDGVALLHRGDARADGVDDPRALVPEHDRRRIRDGAVDDAQVRVTEAGGAQRDPDLARAGVLHANVLDRDRTVRRPQDRSLHASGFPMCSVRPGFAPVSLPFSTIVSPFTMARTLP